jgi:hypothetical protein
MRNQNMVSKQEFSPLCDLHHTSMQRVVIEEVASKESQSFHECERRDCSRIYREGNGYSDIVDGQFDNSRAHVRVCPACEGVLYLVEVDRVLKIENWECPQMSCNYMEKTPSPSSR